MSLSPFEVEVLGRVADDYEAVETIRDDLARDLRRPVSDEEVGVTLLALTRAGLVDAFFYDAAATKYRPAEIETVPVADLWFLTNKKGRAQLEQFRA